MIKIWNEWSDRRVREAEERAEVRKLRVKLAIAKLRQIFADYQFEKPTHLGSDSPPETNR
jgi:hypothetical protein